MPLQEEASTISKITGHDQGPIIIAAIYVFISISFAVALVRGITRYRCIRSVELTDVLILLALLLAILQSICVTLEVGNGLGRHWDILLEKEQQNYKMLHYVGEIFYMLSISLTNAIVLLLIKNVEPPYLISIACNGMLGFVATYTMATTLVLAFQCALPTPWQDDNHKCIDRITFYNSINIINIVTDFAIVALPILMLSMLRSSCNRKLFVCSLFGTRILVPLATIPQAYYLHSVLGSADRSWLQTTPQIWTQIVLNLSLITACIPSLGRTIWDFGQGLTERTSHLSQDLESARKFGRRRSFRRSTKNLSESSIVTQVQDLGLDEKHQDYCDNKLDPFGLSPLSSPRQESLQVPRKSYLKSSLGGYREKFNRRDTAPIRCLSALPYTEKPGPLNLTRLLTLSYECPRTPPLPPMVKL